jgi:hypothetical protein
VAWPQRTTSALGVSQRSQYTAGPASTAGASVAAEAAQTPPEAAALVLPASVHGACAVHASLPAKAAAASAASAATRNAVSDRLNSLTQQSLREPQSGAAGQEERRHRPRNGSEAHRRWKGRRQHHCSRVARERRRRERVHNVVRLHRGACLGRTREEVARLIAAMLALAEGVAAARCAEWVPRMPGQCEARVSTKRQWQWQAWSSVHRH